MTETRVPKIKRIDPKRRLRLPILNILLVFFCSFLLILATFVQFDIIHPRISTDLFLTNPFTRDSWYSYTLIPQIPMVLFIAGVLGRKLGMTSIMVYIIIGLFAIPVFALGGGLRYILEYGFGYILAYLPAVFFVGSILKNGYSLINMIKATLVGVFTIHIIGVLYMLLIVAIQNGGFELAKSWIISQSGLKIIYDIIISLFALIIAKIGNKYIIYLLY